MLLKLHYRLFLLNSFIVKMQNYDILAMAGLRIDGRRPDDIRNMKHNFGLVKSADGSAYLEQGLNKVLALVHGPQEPKKKSNDQSDGKVIMHQT